MALIVTNDVDKIFDMNSSVYCHLNHILRRDINLQKYSQNYSKKKNIKYLNRKNLL